MMKRFLGVLMAGALCIGVAACGGATGSGDASGNASGDASGDITAVKPEYDPLDYVTLGQYTGFDVTATEYTVSDEDVEEYIDNILESEKSKGKSDKQTVEDGDTVNIDFKGYMDGELFDGGTGEDYELEIGSGSFIDDFEDQLVGHDVGDEVEVNVTFPEDYSVNEDYAGLDAMFEVTINYIYEDEETVPEYTDDFVDEYTDGEYTTTKDYDKYVREKLEKEADSDTEASALQAVQDEVYDNCECTGLPDGLVDYYCAVQRSYDEKAAKSYGYEFDDYISQFYSADDEDAYIESMTSYFEDQYLPQTLIREAIFKDMGLTIDDEIMDNYLKGYVEDFGYTDVDSFLSAYGFDSVDDFYEYVGGKENMEDAALSLEMWDRVMDTCNITYEPEETASGDASGED